MSENNGNGKPPATRREEYDKATAGLKFTKDFDDAIDAVMRDELETASTRVLAWLKRRSWGNFSLYCVDDNGKELFQQDCARELDIDKRRVSKTMQYLEARGYLERRGTAKVLYPVLSPVLSGPDPSIVKESPAWATFLDHWKVAHAGDFSEYEVARATYERIRKVLFADYCRWRTQATKSPASLMRDVESIESKESSSSEVSQEIPPETTTTIDPVIDQIITESVIAKIETDFLIERFNLEPAAAGKLLSGCRERDPVVTVERIREAWNQKYMQLRNQERTAKNFVGLMIVSVINSIPRRANGGIQ